MTVFTESQHQGEFLVSQGPGRISFEEGTLLSGQNVIDGTVLADNGSGKLIAADGSTGQDVKGIAFGAKDASSGDTPITYVARLAEVDESLVTASNATGATVDWAALNALFIIQR